MEYFTTELCEILLDLTALSVCVFVALFIMISTFKNKQKISGTRNQEESDKQTDNFNEVVMAQLIKEQFDKSLADVVGAINDEKLSNNEVVQKNSVQEKADQNKVDHEEIGEEIDQKIIDQKPATINLEEDEQSESDNSEIINKISADTLDAVDDEKVLNTNLNQEPEEMIKEEMLKEENMAEPEYTDPNESDQDKANQDKAGQFEIIDKYDEAADLVKSGMNVSAISDRVNLPMGEIEVIVNMNRLRNEASRAA
ncbi:MAG: hypothetical protein JJV89_01790 [Desulfosarcina sp.]|nr:hypothetical protein [Desulfobacterales bacterium]